jgi:integrase
MHKDHPNVSIIAGRKRRTQIILRCTYKGDRWEVPAGRDPKAARRKAIAISQDIEQVKMGIKQLNDVRADSKATTPVKLLLDEWEAHLKASGVTAYHIATQIQRATDLLAAGGIERIGPKSGAKVRDALVRMRDADASAQTIKHYKQAIGQFERWMVTAQHMPHALIAPRLADLKTNVAADRRHRRRAFTKQEFAALLEWLANDQKRCEEARAKGLWGLKQKQMDPAKRSLLYRLGIATMLRAGELRSLTVNSLKLKGDQPHIVLEAKDEKARRGARQPISRQLADELHSWFAGKTGQLFPGMPNPPAEMIRRDVLAAGLSYRTSDGVLDFHALRHTGGAWLVAAGVNIQIVKQLMRHSTITLTMDTYGHMMPGDERSAVENAWEAMPKVSPFVSPFSGQEVEQTRTTANSEKAEGTP